MQSGIGSLENSLEFLIKFDIHLLHGPLISLPEVSPKEVKKHVHTKAYLQIFKVTLFTIAQNRKQSRASVSLFKADWMSS